MKPTEGWEGVSRGLSGGAVLLGCGSSTGVVQAPGADGRIWRVPEIALEAIAEYVRGNVVGNTGDLTRVWYLPKVSNLTLKGLDCNKCSHQIACVNGKGWSDLTKTKESVVGRDTWVGAPSQTVGESIG